MINTKQERWNTVYENGVKFNQNSNSKILDTINSVHNKDLNILDIGCGVGELSIFLNKNGCNVVGADISNTAINKAEILNKESNTNVKFIVGDIYDINEKFDAIICKLVYAFIEDKNIFLEKVKSILNKSGRFVISTPVITEENKNNVLKPGICITEKDIEFLKNSFSEVNLTLDIKDNFGDNYIIECII